MTNPRPDVCDEAFNNLPTGPCFLIWRVEQFLLKRWQDPGAFCTGDSYLILNAYKVGTSQTVRRDIYFWIGSESSQDEYGTVAYKAVELDDHFGGQPTQFREVQFHESDRFHKLFEKNGGIRYLEGGVDSGFNKVEFDNSSVLYQVKGRRRPVLQQVPLSGNSLNHGDAFILQTPTKFFLWFGKGANMMEKNKAATILDLFRTKKPKFSVERLEKSATTPEFWEALGGETEIKSAEEGGEDQEFEASNVRVIVRCNGEHDFTPIATGAAATADKLTTDGIFFVTRGKLLLAWIGAGSSQDLRKNAILFASNYLKSAGLPEWIPVSTMREGNASEDFDIVFA